MAITQLEKLHEEIEAYPARLQEALERKLNAEALAAKLAHEFNEEKERLAQPSEEDNTLTEEREENLKLDFEISKLQLHYDQKRGKLELEYRRNPPPGEKVTEATVSAYLNSNEELVTLNK